MKQLKVTPISLTASKIKSKCKDPIRKMKSEITKMLTILNTSFSEVDIEKMHTLQLYGQWEIMRDVLIYFYGELEKSKNILIKYDNNIPIINTATIVSYLQDILMLAEIRYSQACYRRRRYMTMLPIPLDRIHLILRTPSRRHDIEIIRRYASLSVESVTQLLSIGEDTPLLDQHYKH